MSGFSIIEENSPPFLLEILVIEICLVIGAAWEYPQIYSRFAQLTESGKRIDGIVARIPSGGACTW
jgi:hypothetical protein